MAQVVRSMTQILKAVAARIFRSESPLLSQRKPPSLMSQTCNYFTCIYNKCFLGNITNSHKNAFVCSAPSTLQEFQFF
jgi:hypothetical protein